MNAEEWLAAHGGPRRFQRGDTSDLYHLKYWLASRGWELIVKTSLCTLSKTGVRRQPKIMTQAKVLQIVDEIRIAEGLEPMSAASRRQ